VAGGVIGLGFHGLAPVAEQQGAGDDHRDYQRRRGRPGQRHSDIA
jgi:hypothetical protein